MKRITAVLVALIFCVTAFVPALAVNDPPFSVEITGSLDAGKPFNEQSTLIISWKVTANRELTLRNTQGLRLAYDNTVLQLMRWDGAGAIPDSSMGPNFGIVPQTGLIGAYKSPLYVYIAKNATGDQGFLSVSLGDPYDSYTCKEGEAVTLAQLRFSFRPGKSQSGLSAKSIRCMDAGELAATSQNHAVLINTNESSITSYIYLGQANGVAIGGDTLDAPVFDYPHNTDKKDEDAVIGSGGDSDKKDDDGAIGSGGDSDKKDDDGVAGSVGDSASENGPASQDIPAEPVAADESAVFSNPYTDVRLGNWFYDAVKYVTEKGLMNGTGNNEFSPNAPMTRAMFATTLHRLAGRPGFSGGNPFVDVPGGQWYTDAVSWASENKIVLGYGNGIFGPNNSITREQAVTVLFRYSEGQGLDVDNQPDLLEYTDASEVSDWALSAVSWAVGAGVISGRTTTTLAPQGLITRAEVAQILLNCD